MQDILQQFANGFCAEFGLVPVQIKFTLEFSMEDIRLYSMLLCPQKQSPDVKPLIKNEKKLVKLIEEERYDAAKDLLWKKIVTNQKLGAFVSHFELEDMRAFRAAIDIVEGRAPAVALNKEQLDYANDIANRMRKLHSSRVIPEIRNLYVRAYNAAVKGEMPLLSTDKKDTEKYIHEAIHYILFENKIYTSHNPFDEGLCTFLHIKSRGEGMIGEMYGIFSGSHHYMGWAKYFFEKFAKTPPGQIGHLLRANLAAYLQEFQQKIG